jgi:3-oxoacyl-[acyl-carrier protein] reductase
VESRESIETERPIVLVTGASGGVGSAIVDALAQDYFVVAMTRSHGLRSADSNVAQLQADLSDDGWTEAFRGLLAGKPLFGIVHAAWPGQPAGSLLQTDDSVIEQQLSFAASRTIALARFLFANSAGSGRMIALSSVVATLKPVLSLAAYSLGKAALEHTVKLLAPELARKQITINAISPSFIATGMNRQSTDRQQMKERALIPMGRLCEGGDVTALVRYLLSADASFVSGQVIGLAGAQL